MEWCYRLDPAIEPDRLEALCTLANLSALCSDVYELTGQTSDEWAEISCVWGVFDTRRTAVRNGVRYELISCPNALQWTITTRKGETTLHGSINSTDPDPDLAESIQVFLENFRAGLAAKAALN